MDVILSADLYRKFLFLPFSPPFSSSGLLLNLSGTGSLALNRIHQFSLAEMFLYGWVPYSRSYIQQLCGEFLPANSLATARRRSNSCCNNRAALAVTAVRPSVPRFHLHFFCRIASLPFSSPSPSRCPFPYPKGGKKEKLTLPPLGRDRGARGGRRRKKWGKRRKTQGTEEEEEKRDETRHFIPL